MTEMHGAVHWVNGNPILDGMSIFKEPQACLDYISEKEEIDKALIAQLKMNGISSRWTIIRLRMAEPHNNQVHVES